MTQTGIKAILTAGGLALACVATLASGVLSEDGGVREVSAPYEPTSYESTPQAPTATPLSTDSPDLVLANAITYESNSEADEWHYGRSIHGLMLRWNGEMLMYSSDDGETWAEFTPSDRVPFVRHGAITIWGGEGTPPDFDFETFRQKIAERVPNIALWDSEGGLTLWDGEGDLPAFDLEAFRQRIIENMPDIVFEADERFAGILTESGGILLGDVAVRQVDGVWEFSHDYGETWATEKPDGLEIIDIDDNVTEIYSNGNRIKLFRKSIDNLDEFNRDMLEIDGNRIRLFRNSADSLNARST